MTYQVAQVNEAKYNVAVLESIVDIYVSTNGQKDINFDMIGASGEDAVVVDWGDGNTSELTMDGSEHEITHSYAASGVQILTISNPANITGLKFGYDTISNLSPDISDFALCVNLTDFYVGLLETTITGSVNNLPVSMVNLQFKSTTGNVTGVVTHMVNLEIFRTGEPLTGNLTGCSNLCRFYLGWHDGIEIDIDITDLKQMIFVDGYSANSTLTGSWDGHTLLEHICIGRTPNTFTGDISGCSNFWYLDNTGGSSMTGDITLLTNMIRFRSYDCNNAFTGDFAAHTKLEELRMINDNSSLTKLTTVANKPSLGSLQVDHWVFSAAEVNQILADKWADRDAAYVNTIAREFRLAYGASEAPTGQGLIDKAALQAYRSPNDDPANALWYILTN